jgi:hypothetical protein
VSEQGRDEGEELRQLAVAWGVYGDGAVQQPQFAEAMLQLLRRLARLEWRVAELENPYR